MRRLAHFLPAVNQHRPARETEQNRRPRAPHFHAHAGPLARARQPHFVVVFRVAQRAVEERAVARHGVEIVRPLRAVVDAFERLVARVVIDRVEARREQCREHVAARHFHRVVVVGFGEEKRVRFPRPRPPDGPRPKLRRHQVRHIAAEAIDAERLPMREHAIHFPPGVRDRLPRLLGGRILPRAGGEIVAVVQLDRLIPVVRPRRPRGQVVARRFAVIALAVEKPVACTEDAAGRAHGLAVAHRRQPQRRTAAGRVGLEVKEVVLRIEELPPVVRRAEIRVRRHHRAVAARQMIRHEVDHHPQPRRPRPPEQRPKLRQPLRRLHRIVRAHVVAVLDRIRRTRQPLEQIRIIRRQPQRRVIRGRGLPQHPRQPQMRETQRPQRAQRRVIDVRKLPHAILRQRAVRLPRPVHVAEKPREQLVNADARVGGSGIHGERRQRGPEHSAAPLRFNQPLTLRRHPTWRRTHADVAPAITAVVTL